LVLSLLVFIAVVHFFLEDIRFFVGARHPRRNVLQGA